MRFFMLVPALFGLAAVAQNCGPSYGNTVCAAGNCCSQYGWCDTDAAHCDPATCLSKFSGPGSSCAAKSSTTKKTTTTKKSTSTKKPTSTKTTSTSKVSGSSSSTTSSISKSTGTKTTTSSSKTSSVSSSTISQNSQYATTVPEIDVCGATSSGVSCPGAGINGYFYRCCSSHGHCGPKNNIQDQGLYCGDGCQKGFGKCDSEAKPPNPSGTPGVAQNGETCGPIVNKKCAAGLCCSGSNFCGNTADFCGAANWCQPAWGACSGK